MFQRIYHNIENGKEDYFLKEIRINNNENIKIKRCFLPPERLILLGGGHVAKEVYELAGKVEFELVIVDNRPSFANSVRFPDAKKVICDNFETAIDSLQISAYDYVAVLTSGHKNDMDCLRRLMSGTKPFYLGLIGSKRRVTGCCELLLKEGFKKEMVEAVHTPIGLSIGAVTPAEIAISIVAELIQCRRENTYQKDKTVLVQKNSDLELLKYLAFPGTKSAYAIVIETKGSTPVKSGAMMAVDRMGRIWGTVGGGCGEHMIMQEAFSVIDSGVSKVIQVDMTNDVAEMEGMVCGGTMTVYIEKLS